MVAGDRWGLWRSRWAAIGAAIAIIFGGGGIFAVQAASSPASSVVTIDPVRILDTRVDGGLAGPFVSRVSRKLQVTGAVPTPTGVPEVVPVGATGVLLNVTVVAPTAAGFVSVRPGDATGAPSTSSLNFNAGDIVPNSVQVALPTTGAHAGTIDITYDAFGVAGPTTDVLIDVVGHLVTADSTPEPTGLGILGQFVPTQVIDGAIVTCTTFSLNTLYAVCDGLKLDGLDVALGTASANAICAAVTGKSAGAFQQGSASTNPYFSWDGTNWVLNSGTTNSISGLFCTR